MERLGRIRAQAVTYPSISRVSLGDILEEVDVRAGSTLSDLPVLSLTKDRGLIPQSDRFKQRVARDDVSEYKVIRKGQIAHNSMFFGRERFIP